MSNQQTTFSKEELDKAVEEAYRKGYIDGELGSYDEGHDEGYYQGHDDGYTRGYNQAKIDNGISII